MLKNLRSETEDVLIVEGYMDVVSALLFWSQKMLYQTQALH